MPTTTKMGIVYPSSTDLVKDGATAMGTISTTVDNKTGLVLIATSTFSAQSSVSLANNSFSSNFDYYRLYIVLTGSTTSQTVSARLRASGSDASGSNYNYQDSAFDSTTVAGARSTNQTSWRIGNAISTSKNYSMLDLIDPFLAEPTAFFVNHSESGFSTTSVAMKFTNGGHTLSTSYDSLSFYPASGTITGKYTLFGVNK